MYSYEIDNEMRNRNYYLDSHTYENICETSPQISRVKYEPYDNYFMIKTNDGHEWQFQVYHT